MRKKVWNVLGHTYSMKAASETSFAFETYDPPGPRSADVHPTRTAHLHLGGVFTLYLRRPMERRPGTRPDAEETAARLHTGATCRPWAVLGDPGRSAAQLFHALHDLTDPAEVVRSPRCTDVNFLPPGLGGGRLSRAGSGVSAGGPTRPAGGARVDGGGPPPAGRAVITLAADATLSAPARPRGQAPRARRRRKPVNEI